MTVFSSFISLPFFPSHMAEYMFSQLYPSMPCSDNSPCLFMESHSWLHPPRDTCPLLSSLVPLLRCSDRPRHFYHTLFVLLPQNFHAIDTSSSLNIVQMCKTATKKYFLLPQEKQKICTKGIWLIIITCASCSGTVHVPPIEF